MVFKCKMCGGDITPIEGTNTGKCNYCKSVMTLPNSDNEKIVNLYNRANDFRLANEFDKAYGIYEMILELDNKQVEAHWGLLLCKYGVEYVDDPKTKTKIPTCHRTITNSILKDKEFEIIKKESFGEALELYNAEAKRIDEIQKGILEISSKEDPYDIFICYKESDEDGERTHDSVIAEDIYDKLVEKGYKVFFARRTLEDKLGTEYEPYIYSALISSKVMLVIGTKEEHFNAVWVKNEWSRFLEMMKEDKNKNLIPVYSKIDAYKLPEEFAMLQAQSMDKIGAIQDLCKGIDKLVDTSKKKVDTDFTYEMYEKFKQMKEEEEREIRESQEANKPVSKVFETTNKKFKIVSLLLSIAQAITIILLYSNWIVKDFYNEYSLYATAKLDYGAVQLVLFSCFITFVAYFVGMFSKKANKFSKYMYLTNMLIMLYLCYSFNSINYQLSVYLILFNVLNLALFLYRPSWKLSEKVIYVTTERKQQILEENKELKKNFKEKDKSKINIVLLVVAVIVFGLSVVFNYSVELKCQSNERNSSVKQLKITNDFINVRASAGTSKVKVGKVYRDEIYTILDTIDGGNGTYWYKIKTETGLTGYIYSGKQNEMVELLGK